MTSWDQLDTRGQIALARVLARQALRAHGLDPTSLRTLGHAENTTFDARTSGGRFMVRVHRAGYNSTEQVRSELMLLEALSSWGRVAVPRPHAAPDGEHVLTLHTPGLDAPRDVVVFHWVHGRAVEKVPRASTYEKLGEVTALLHTFARDWHRPPGFQRRSAEGSRGQVDTGTCVPLEAISGVDAETMRTLFEARAAASEIIDALEARDGAGIPIHADLHVRNVLHQPDALAVIDFDDACIAHPLADMGVPIGGALLPMHAPYLRGYRRVADIDDAWERALPAYAVMRGVMILGWIVDRSRTVPWIGRHLERSAMHSALLGRWLLDGDPQVLEGLATLPPPRSR